MKKRLIVHYIITCKECEAEEAAEALAQTETLCSAAEVGAVVDALIEARGLTRFLRLEQDRPK